MATVGRGWEIPPEADSIGDFRWFKVRPQRALTLVVLSEEPYFYRGHFVNGRMIPCAGDLCLNCSNGVGAQIRWVFAGFDPYTGQMGIIELGRSVGFELRARSEKAGKFRGLVLKLWRHGKSEKSRVEMDVLDMDVSKTIVGMRAPDIAKALKLTWNRGSSVTEEVERELDIPEKTPFERALERVRERGSNGEARTEVS